MAGNTRGKLKEHFEGIHRNLDWSLYHINKSLQLIYMQLKEVQLNQNLPTDDEAMAAVVEQYPLYVGVRTLGEGITTLDELANNVYGKL